MSGEDITLGGLHFDGVEIRKSQVKNNPDGKKLYCVWTEAGYIEYEEQKRNIHGESSAVIHSVTNMDIRDKPEYQEMYGGKYKQLYLGNVTNATFKYNSDDYLSVGVGGDDEGFTLDTRNGRPDNISVFNNAKVLTDNDDNVRKKNFSKLSN